MAAPNDEEIDKNFSECISKAAESPTYKSTDGGKSARKMLEANCPAPYIAWVHSCIAHGDAKNSCVLKAAISAQAALKMLDK